MEIITVYSALHTGTWFVCNAIASCKKEPYTKSDAWIREIHNCTIEELGYPSFLSDNFLQELLTQQKESSEFYPPETDLVILQAHQRKSSNLYKKLLNNEFDIPVVCPMRDPLLSLHTRIWRESGSFEKLNKQSDWERQHRVHDQLNSILRILNLSETCYIMPIDIPAYFDESNRRTALEMMIGYCGLSPTKGTENISHTWQPVNATPGGANPQRKHHHINDDQFMGLKDLILNQDEDNIKSIIAPEYKLLKEFSTEYNLKTKLMALNYDKFFWMQ
jgi:hypothetical protein